jgi:AraC family transcriptional activator of mtrCDE
MSPAQLDGLLSSLSVEFVRLTECVVSPGWRLNLGGSAAPGIHYNLTGRGRVVMEGHPPFELYPHTLFITPPNQYFFIEVPSKDGNVGGTKEMEGRWKSFPPGAIRRFVAGEDGPSLMLICGYFEASYGASMNLFSTLKAPIVEQFDGKEHLDTTLQRALQELIDQEVGSGAMSSTLLKLVLVALLRRSLTSLELWVERFSLLGDPNVATAFSQMAAHPGAHHTIESLARAACLSRSSFMVRFSEVLGRPPMVVLRDLRMRQAASLLSTSELSVNQIAQCVGYVSRSSFLRAFRSAYEIYPSEYRLRKSTENPVPTRTQTS